MCGPSFIKKISFSTHALETTSIAEHSMLFRGQNVFLSAGQSLGEPTGIPQLVVGCSALAVNMETLWIELLDVT